MYAANEARCDWDVPQPALRLWLTLALGGLGVLLFRGEMEFFNNPFADIGRTTLVAWMAAVFAAALLLRRMEKVNVPGRMVALMAAALALSAIYPPALPGGGETAGGPVRSGWLCLMFVLLLAAGASGTGLRFELKAGRPWGEYLLRGPAIALAAPLLLFASRPARGKPFSRAQALSRAAFAAFPCMLAGGYTVTLLGFKFYRYARHAGLAWLSFSVWAWFGCALLFLLNPWPVYPRALKPEESHRERIVSRVGIVCVIMAIMLVPVFFHGHLASWKGFLAAIAAIQLLVWPLLLCAFLLLVGPWTAHHRVPRMGELPEARKSGFLVTAIFMATALVPLGSFAWRPFLAVMTGRIFGGRFDTAHAGSALDQPTIGKWLFLFTFFGLIVFAYVATARWMSDRRSRMGYWTFTAGAVALCACLLVILTGPSWWLVQYVRDMGFTTRRLMGLAYALGGYIVVLGFLHWALRPPGRERASQEANGDRTKLIEPR